LRRHHLDDPMNTMRRKSLTLLALPVWLAELDSNYAALWNARMLRIQPVSGFQLAKIWGHQLQVVDSKRLKTPTHFIDRTAGFGDQCSGLLNRCIAAECHLRLGGDRSARRGAAALRNRRGQMCQRADSLCGLTLGEDCKEIRE
jgi:hypothetical protein